MKLVDVGRCCQCGSEMLIPDELYRAAVRSPDISFYCAYGHKQHYPAGETEADKQRRRAERLEQQLAQKDDAIRYERKLRALQERSARAYKGQVTRLKNRAGKGVCPCCNRHFTNLQRHMENKHPDFADSETNVVDLESKRA